MYAIATNGTKERKAIIFAADVVAYSKHMEQDQLGTLNSLATCETIIKTLFQKHNARLFNTGGDSFFAEFENPFQEDFLHVNFGFGYVVQESSSLETRFFANFAL